MDVCSNQVDRLLEVTSTFEEQRKESEICIIRQIWKICCNRQLQSCIIFLSTVCRSISKHVSL